MNRLPGTLYDFLTLGLGGETFQSFVDHYNERYDRAEIDGFTFAPVQLGYTWQQLISQVATTVLPTYVDPESPGYEMPLSEIAGATGNIPTFKNRYRLNRVTVREKLQLAQKLGSLNGLTADIRDTFMQLLDEGIESHIKSYYNALTNQRMQVVSTGKFTIDLNNPRGYRGVTLEFGVPATHFDSLTGTARWWTNTDHSTEGNTSDPIKYLKDKVKAIRRTYHYVGRLKMEISRDLLEDMLGHSKVLLTLGQRLYPISAVDTAQGNAAAVNYAKNSSEDALLAELRKVIGVDSIVARDSWAYVSAPGTNAAGDPDLVATPIQNFDSHNVAFVPEGNLGQFMGVEPLTLGYDPDKVASYNGGRLKLQERAEPDTHSIYIDSEAAQLAVPSQPHNMFICVVTA